MDTGFSTCAGATSSDLELPARGLGLPTHNFSNAYQNTRIIIIIPTPVAFANLNLTNTGGEFASDQTG